MMVEKIKIIVKERMLMRIVEIEKESVENSIERKMKKISIIDEGVRVEREDKIERKRKLIFRKNGYIVKKKEIGKIDMIEKKIEKSKIVLLKERIEEIKKKIK